jgi:PAS domain S-box-containing protein
MEAPALDRFPDGAQTLLEDGDFVLSRRRDARDTTSPSRSVLILMPRSEHPRPQAVRILEHEHSLRDELDPAWAIRSLALTTYDGRAVLVLEDPGADLLVQRTGAPMDLGDVLRTGAGVAAALRQLHGRGFIHKDIKPATLMTDWRTGRVWLRGLGIASRLPRERRPPEPPEFISGTLAYMAPEQTGWMNRSIDARSDLYALGVVLYELSTGSLPFTASDPMAWVHGHIAKRPVPPTERQQAIPEVISAIVMKLLAKTAEDRYQTAAGVERDLRRGLAQWEADGRIDAFALAEHDIPDRLIISEKLYGRGREIETLLGAFERVVTSGTPELVLVSGYSGIGKSSVVNELHKVLVPSRGLFASGKFDQYKRDIPYATLAQAFQQLIQSLLGKSEAELSRWRDALREALDPNGQLIVDLVPNLALIIGNQLPVPVLSPQDARRRFQFVFRRFLGVFARPEHPLALFLDDLQWLDAATLDLLEDLLSVSAPQHLILIGAYRDNEVTAAHPLTHTLGAIRNAGTPVQEIRLAPLTGEDVRQLVADALRCEPARAAPLAELLRQKTGGNPFFVIQFIIALADEGLLTFDHQAARWSWDLERIHAKGYTANVVDLMAGKLNRLPVATQKGLQEFACLGHSADASTLALVRGTPEAQVHADLWEAVRLELIERLDGAYRFVHDRVQEAAYSLIPEHLRAAAHLRIGRLLAAHTAPEKREEVIFEIVNQLNRGVALITSPTEREQLAEFNLIAGTRAENATACTSALTYFAAGRYLLPEECWDRCRALTFALEFHRARCEFLTGAYAAAEERLLLLSSRADRLVDFAAVASLEVELFTTLGAIDRAVEACLAYLRRIGVQWTARPTEEEVRQEYERIWRQIGSRSIEELVDAPLMVDPEWRATMDVLTAALPPALFTDEKLLCLVICRMANLSLEHGSSDAACVAYVSLGMLLGPRFGNYRAGFSFGKLGLDLVDRRGLGRFESRVCVMFGGRVSPWTQPVRAGLSLVWRAFDAASRLGDLTYAGLTRNVLIINLLFAGDPLADVEREAAVGLDFARRFGFGHVIDYMVVNLALVRTLRGLNPEFGSFNGTEFDEGQFERRLANDPRLSTVARWYWICQLQARFFAGAYGDALAAASNVRSLQSTPGSLEVAEYQLYAALVRAALCDTASEAERTRHQEALAAHHRQFQEWAENCPANFEGRAGLIGAEIARIDGRTLDAEQLYEAAIRSARANGFVHNEAVANELAARFYAARGFETTSHAYLREARYGYLRWGADGKVRQLDRLHPRLKDESPVPGPTSTIGAPAEQLDLDTVIKVSQAVSGEIVLEKLLDTLMRLAIEQAGAERGLLIVPRGTDLHLEAEATTSGGSVVVRVGEAPLAAAATPESILRYVVRTRESVVVDDASADPMFSADAYVRDRHARSLLCLPLLKRARLTGVLYLENNLAPRVFTPARIAVLKLLASQAAMSLEETRLYQALQRSQLYLSEAQRLAHMGSWALRPNQEQLVHWSDELLRIFGFDQGTAPTQDDILNRVHPDDRERAQQRSRKQFNERQDYAEEYRVLLPDGTVKHFYVIGHPILDGTGQVVEYIGTTIDITERKRAQAELLQAQTALAHRQRVSLLGEVAASLAHEIKQPIAALTIDATACLRALADHRVDLREARRAASRILKEATWADEIMTRTSALYRKGRTQRERVDVNGVIRQMVVLLQLEAAASSIAIRTELAEGLQAVIADRVQLQQVLMNLMLNAIEAMKDIGGDLTVTSHASQDGELLISVRDTGVGLPTDNPDQIFESFVTTKPHGTGMGLTISRSIVESHGGRLWATANTGPGATFLFTLPGDVAEQNTSR